MSRLYLAAEKLFCTLSSRDWSFECQLHDAMLSMVRSDIYSNVDVLSLLLIQGCSLCCRVGIYRALSHRTV